jgi:hypothetical protein
VRRIVVAAIAVLGLVASLPVGARAQELPRRLGGENGPKKATDAKRPAPMLADGTVDLSGVWTGGGDAPIPRLLGKDKLEALMMPWAKQKMASVKEADDPYFYCMPGGPLRITGGFAWRLVHPDDANPTWYGHSVGHWEGKTLVVDTVGLNDKFWLDSAGTPHTEKLHLIERYTRTDYNTLQRVVTIDDPGTFTKPFEVTYTAKLGEPDSEIIEYFCIENNQWGERSNPNATAAAIPVAK